MTSPVRKPAVSETPPPAGTVDAFKSAMRVLASGVSVITAGAGDGRRGVTASAVCSVTMEPPTLLVCVNRAGESYEAIREAGSFCVNLLGGDGEAAALCFAGQTEHRGVEQFAPFSWTSLKTGAPALEGALANVDCEISDTIDKGTHAVFFGTVREVRVREGTAALVHFNRSFTSV
ncbi:flavin reductase family protein [Roseibium aggregatum]|uniref:Flavin reductase family protein n=1 Tax=Roseibium aggregatum TaxID=187304 RepID=A0A939EJ03_9HYPH|nr:flavin reductase family protein [Roseibium aggregatum]MBN9673894.1 flavin reductase family protein [Roseibium aggregatum]